MINERAYFAAHAPNVPEWFEYVPDRDVSSNPHKLVGPYILSKKQEADLFFAWRWYYADKMMEMNPNVCEASGYKLQAKEGAE